MREDDTPCCETKFWVYVGVSVALVSFAGLTSGLSIGLLSYSKVDLEVLIKAGLPQDRTNAAKILPIVKNECLLLCTLLIGKSLAMETLPIFLDTILPFWGAILVSVTFVMAFAEVIPQAVCSRYGLSFGAKFVSFVQFLLFIFFPVAYPISKLLDWLLGKSHSSLLRRTELKTLVDLHSVKVGRGGDLTDDEATIITGALNMTEKTAKDAMTPISKTFSLDVNSKLDMYTMGAIVSRGHSLVPIHAGNPTRIPRVHDGKNVLKLFQEGHSHMAVVVKSRTEPDFVDIKIDSDSEPTQKDRTDPSFTNKKLLDDDSSTYRGNGGTRSPRSENIKMRSHDLSHPLNGWERGDANISKEDIETLKTKFLHEEVIGIITMEDVMEELLQEEILDETDHHVDIHKIRVNILSPRRISSATEVASISSPSSYHLSPILRSPMPPFIPSPFVKPILYASPVKSTLNSPARYIATVRSSTSSPLQVSRKSYERSRQPNNA